jgi:hypothetical protein
MKLREIYFRENGLTEIECCVFHGVNGSFVFARIHPSIKNTFIADSVYIESFHGYKSLEETKKFVQEEFEKWVNGFFEEEKIEIQK